VNSEDRPSWATFGLVSGGLWARFSTSTWPGHLAHLPMHQTTIKGRCRQKRSIDDFPRARGVGVAPPCPPGWSQLPRSWVVPCIGYRRRLGVISTQVICARFRPHQQQVEASINRQLFAVVFVYSSPGCSNCRRNFLTTCCLDELVVWSDLSVSGSSFHWFDSFCICCGFVKTAERII